MIVLALLWRAFSGPRLGRLGWLGIPASLDRGVCLGKEGGESSGKRRGGLGEKQGGVGRSPPFSLCLGAPLGVGLGVPLGWGWRWKRSDTDDFGTNLRAIPRGRGGILHLRHKIFSVVVSVLFRGKCVQLRCIFWEVFLVKIWLVLGI